MALAAPPWLVSGLTDPGRPAPVGVLDLDADGDLDEVAFADGRLVRFDGVPGGFAPPVTLAAVSGWGTPSWEDATGDGLRDLLFQDHLAVVDADGWWRTALVFDAFVPQSNPVLVDLDGDALPEVLLMASDGLWAAGNDGGGSFRPFTLALPLAIGGANDALTTGDADGDGDLDVLRLGWAGADWLRNDGGTFAAPARLVDAVMSARFVDWEGDGDLDVLGQSASPAGTWIVLNAGGGAFGAETVVGPSLSPILATGDLNGDRRADVVYALRSGPSIAVQTAAGRLGADSPVPAGRGTPTAAWVGDTDGDGDGDLLLTDGDGHALATNTGGALAFTPLAGLPPCGLDLSGYPQPAGRTLPIEQPAGPPSLVFPACGRTLVTDGAGGFTAVDTAPDFGRDTVVVDVDQDGLDDHVSLGVDDPLVWRRNVAGSLDAPARLPPPDRDPDHLAAGDLDGDGDVDLLVTWVERQDSGVSDATSLAAWVLLPEQDVRPAWRVGEVLAAGVPVAVDLDGDADADAAVRTAAGVTWLRENLGDGTLAPRTSVTGYVTGALDLDGDGLVDLYGTGADGTVTWWPGTGVFAWGAETSLGTRADAVSLLGDADGDGRWELWSPLDGQTAAFEGGPAGLGAPLPLVQGQGDLVVDLDGDGDLDLTGGGLAWWNDAAAPTPPSTGDTGAGPTDTGTRPPPLAHSGDPAPTAPRPRGDGEDGGCGCASGGGSGPWGLLALVVVGRRRSRPSPG